MAHAARKFLFFFLLQIATLRTALAVDCYGVNGFFYPDNVICPGSSSCCGVNSTCLSNRLCHNPGQNNFTFVRGPCAVYPYTTDSCAQICVFNETTIDQSFLPRVTLCTDGSYCCDNAPTCCEDGTGVFLDDTGHIVASLPSTSSASQSSTSSLSTTTSSTSISSSAMGTSSSQSPTQSPSTTSSASPQSSAASGLSIGAKIGLGVGIPLGIIALGGLAVMVWLQQKRLRKVERGMTTASANVATAPAPPYDYKQQWAPPQEMDSQQSVASPAELPGADHRASGRY